VRLIKNDEVGAKRRDHYARDVTPVTDDGIKWSYEMVTKEDTSGKQMHPAFLNRASISKLPVAAHGNVNRADILNKINACVERS